MIDFTCLYDKYLKEHQEFLPGVLSDLDTRILYSFVREVKPMNILDCAPREGKSMSAILNALEKNSHIDKNIKLNYWVFEKDPKFRYNVAEYLKYKTSKFTGNIKVYFGEDIYENELLKNIEFLDFIFIDAAHDYILPAYMIEKLHPLLKEGGYMHFHDMHLKNSLEDITFENQPQDFNENDLFLAYTFYNKYYRPGKLWEGDIVKEYIEKYNYDWFSTHQYANKLNIEKSFKVEHCSLYIQKR